MKGRNGWRVLVDDGIYKRWPSGFGGRDIGEGSRRYCELPYIAKPPASIARSTPVNIATLKNSRW